MCPLFYFPVNNVVIGCNSKMVYRSYYLSATTLLTVKLLSEITIINQSIKTALCVYYKLPVLAVLYFMYFCLEK